MKVTRVTYDFFKKSNNGATARLERSEAVELFGFRKSDVQSEDGKDVRESFKMLLLAEMRITPSEWEEYDYYTILLTENEVPDDFLSDEEEEEEDEDEAEE